MLVNKKIDKGFTLNGTGVLVSYEYIYSYQYNTKGQIISVNGSLSGDQDKIQFVYDPVTGDLLSIINPVTGITSFTYDSSGNVLTVNDVNNILTAYTYNGKNKLLSSTHDGKTITRTYTLFGSIETISDAESRTTTYSYEAQYGRLNRLTDMLGNYHQYAYDNLGNMIADSIHDQEGILQKLTRFDYNGPD